MTYSHIRNQPELEQRVHDVVRQLQHDLDLGWLKITNSFDLSSEDRVIAETGCDFEYRQCTIRWSLIQVATLTDDDLQETAVHELVHALNAPTWQCFTSKQQDQFAKLNELSTENVSRVIFHLLHKGI